MSKSSRAASSVRSPTVSASRGTRSAPPKSAAAAAMVDGSSAHAAHAVAGPRAGLVEGDVRVAPEAEHGEVDRRRVEDRLVARGLGVGVGGGAVERLAAADRDAGELAVQVGAEAARVVGAEAEVLVEAEDGHVGAGQRAVGGVGAQRGVQASRGVAGGQQHAQPRACADAVGDELGRGQPDVAGVVEDEAEDTIDGVSVWRRRVREPQRPRARCGKPRSASVADHGGRVSRAADVRARIALAGSEHVC